MTASGTALLRRWRTAAALASGLMLAFSFPPFSADELAWVALVPLVWASMGEDPIRAFFRGLFSGLIFWLVTLAWLLRLGQTGGPWPLVIAGWVLLSGYSALYTGAFGTCTAFVWRLAGADAGNEAEKSDAVSPARQFRESCGKLVFVFAVPVLWTGLEYLRSTLFSGFPWNPLGVSQYRRLVMIQGAEWAGVYAVSAIVVLLNMIVLAALLRMAGVLRRRRQPAFSIEMAAGLAVLCLYWVAGIRAIRREVARADGGAGFVLAAAVQPNIPQTRKWDEDGSIVSGIYESLGRQTELARLLKPDLIIWPETAIPVPFGEDEESDRFVSNLAREGAPILLGALEPAQAGGRTTFFNSSFLVDTNGAIAGIYRKVHLVPFGEYIPGENLIPALKRIAPLGFSCAAGASADPMRLARPPVFFGVLICFEDIFPALARRFARNGAEFLVNQTNDAWFDGSAAAVQHASHFVFRCVENRIDGVRSANTGVTAFVDRIGRMDEMSVDGRTTCFSGFKPGVIRLPPEGRPATLYTRLGDLSFAMPAGIVAGLCFLVVIWGRARTMWSGCALNGEKI